MRRMIQGALVDMYQCVWCNKVFYWRQGLTQPRLNKPIKKYID